MRILLIEPPINTFTGLLKRGYPIGLCMLAAVAKEEKVEEVKVYDVDKSHPATQGLNFTDQRLNMAAFLDAVNDLHHPIWCQIESTLQSFQPDLVGITTMTIQYASALRVAEIVKTWNRNCTVLMGGAHASVMPGIMVEWPHTDAVVKGEGEEPFRKIIQRLRTGVKDLSGIPGVITADSFEETAVPPQEMEDLDTLPFPDRSALMHLDRYSPEDMGLILTSRGCPFRCSYCSNFSRKTRFRSVENVVEEIRRVQNDFGTIQFMFKDDSFTLSRKRVEQFCKTLLEKNIKLLWECTTRLDLMNDALVKLMKRSGCNRVGVGVESGDEEILSALNKKLTKDRIREGTDLLNRNNVFWTGYFMTGLPLEREEQMSRTLEFMSELKPPYAALGIYKPYPGTALFDLAEELGLVSSDVKNDHFFESNPVDYFIKDPHHRSVKIPEARFDEIVSKMENEFDRNNKMLRNVAKRAWARRHIYTHDYKSFAVDVIRAVRWFVPQMKRDVPSSPSKV